MAQYPYTKEDLQDQFGWTWQQVKTRLRYLEVLLSDHYQGSKGVQYRFDNRALAILRRLNDLEGQGYDIKEAAKQIISEVESPEEESKTEDIKEDEGSLKVKVEYLERENKNLKGQVNYLKNQLEKKDDRIQQLLPGKVEEQTPEASPWKLFKNWLFND